MEKFKADDRSAYAQSTKRRDGAMREMLGMGSDPVGHAEGDNYKPQVGIWRIAGNRDRSGAGWTDTVATGVQQGRLLRRNPTSVSALWLFLLSSLTRRNRLLSLSLWSRR